MENPVKNAGQLSFGRYVFLPLCLFTAVALKHLDPFGLYIERQRAGEMLVSTKLIIKKYDLNKKHYV